MSGAITVLIDDPGWRKPRGLSARLRRAAEAALPVCGFKGKSGLTVLLTSDARLKELNRDFRGKNKPTRLIEQGVIEVAPLAYGVTLKEAEAAGKTFADHACHLVVHGVLHLAGYDHEKNRDAQVMEPLEVKILKRLGIADPYKVMA